MLLRERKNRKAPKIIAIIAAILIGVLLLMFNSGIAVLRQISGVVVIPVEKAAGAAFSGVGNFFSSFGSKMTLQKRLDEAEAKLAQQETVQSLAEEMRTENEQLKELLSEKAKYEDMQFVYCQVIAHSTENYSVTYTLNKGSRDGIMKDMPVVAVGGLAGRIIEVNDDWSILMAITDSRSSVPALAEVSRDMGIIKGISESGDTTGSCSMSELPGNALLLPGDSIITSGMGGVFPKGIHIGEITEVSEGGQQLNSYAQLTPGVDFDHLENVLVLSASAEE